MEIEISSDKTKLDVELIHRFLSQDSYWAKGRSLETVVNTIQNSFCIAAYSKGRQVAFARVVTDYCTHAYIMDFFTSNGLRNTGIGSSLLTALLDAPELTAVNKFTLSTDSASQFYCRAGFKPVVKSVLAWERGGL